MRRTDYSKGWTSVGKVLKHNAKNSNLEAALYRHKALKLWQEIAAAFVEQAGSFTQAIDFQKGVLTVACLSREVASKIKLLARQIIAALNQLIGRQAVYAIYLEL